MADTRDNETVRVSRIRAAKACVRCNQRRVKCDATDGIPCSRCRASEQSDCVLVKSRRGRYPRKRDDRTDQRDRTKSLTVASPSGVDTTRTPESPEAAGSTARSDDPAASAVSPADRTHDRSSSLTQAHQGDSSYRDMSWATMFNHFLDTRQNHRQEVIDKCSITYLGESFPLALVLEDLREGGRTRLHHSGPPLGGIAASPAAADNSRHPSHLSPELTRYLTSMQVFELPPQSVCDGLIG